MHLLLQKLTPHHLLARSTGALADCNWRWLKNLLIKLFIRSFGVDMSEAANPDPNAYANFNDFFTRPLRSGARSIDAGANTVVSPVDGAISQIGSADDSSLLQAKNLYYSLHALLGESRARSDRFRNGKFITIYLSPRDYHRIHAPLAGRLVESIYLPGTLFAVDPYTVHNLPNIFLRNERLVTVFETAFGSMALVMVGAMIVAGIQSVWRGGCYPPGRVTTDTVGASMQLEKGAELGRFQLGSTVILLFSPGSLSWSDNLAAGQSIRMGQSIASLQD
jgi:phosphatidylserine decarboxylase|tara:strand:+ start:2546 stop:3379 length:834 start_codon:yes stop_codon:yes gene_type:complete